jgi:hypothetical protein
MPESRCTSQERGRIGVKDFDPCTILLNTDLASGIPGILEGSCSRDTCCRRSARQLGRSRRKSRPFQLLRRRNGQPHALAKLIG